MAADANEPAEIEVTFEIEISWKNKFLLLVSPVPNCPY